MDYKEKYEMALEGIQEILGSGEDSIKMSRLQLRLQGIFPELKESENEKMRKHIIEVLKDNFSGEDTDRCIAWLEKQGEQKPVVIIPKFRVGDEIKTSNEESLTITKIDEKGYWSEDLFICNFDDADNWKLVEQKPADNAELSVFKDKLLELFQAFRWKCKNHILTNGEILEYVDAHIQELIDTIQKPAWSEEDELNLSEALHHIRMYNLANKADKLDKWLKSLKDRVQPQPNQEEWSEEDRITRNALINLVEMYYGGCINKSEKNRLLDWLKSLRPQNWTKEDKERYISCLQRLSTGNPEQPETINSKWFKEHVYPQKQWKPSDEQLNSLYDVLNPCDGLNRDVLESLYNDLKKLREG